MNIQYDVRPDEISTDSPSLFKTKDFYLAAAILAMGAGKYVGVDKTIPQRMVFMFEGEDLDKFQQEWNNKENEKRLLRDYADSLKGMKSIIHGDL